eukprot:CAMPEP_0119050486 /NCGR_PEP_ID=MMETSP1177-20130426/70235_1 /TAXON_ID=2985 /ORGANISM="Ochromonas sp, Strain CCMP1899" /LENGTH=165 /DNA_ID=CAMNT_0007028947 /DNA_START=210 /DNA_END=703 /DNA_ORIENTATION=-
MTPHDGYEQDVLNTLIDSEAVLIEHEVIAKTSTEVSMKVSHVVEPWVIAALLIDAKRAVKEEMINVLPFINEENKAAEIHAKGDSLFTAGRNSRILDPRNPTTTESGIHTFGQLNIFITNIALTEVRTHLKNTNNREGIIYLEESIDNLAQSQTLARLRGEIANP